MVIGKRIVNLNIPASVNITYLKRGDSYIQPVGSTRIEAGDILYVLADDQQALHAAYEIASQT
jgi:NhaP-type Na+/H+ and K+/H+ antiporter